MRDASPAGAPVRLTSACRPSSSTSPATASATPRARSKSINALAAPASRGHDIVVRTSARALAVRSHRPPRRSRYLDGAVRHRRRPDRQPASRRARDDRARGRVLPRLPTSTSTREAAQLRAHDAGLVVADAPPLALRRGARAPASRPSSSRTSRGTGSTRPTPRHWAARRTCCRPFATRTARADGGWRLPLHGGFATVRSRSSIVPFIARHASRDRADVRASGSACRPIGRLALSSFGGYGVADFDRAPPRLPRRVDRRHHGRGEASPAASRRMLPRRTAHLRVRLPLRGPRRAPSTSSSRSRATASSRSAWPTTRRCSTRRAAGSSSTT